MNEKLSATNTKINTKGGLVKQHAKVAEDVVSGWEKAEAEALALKNHLGSVTLSRLTAEDQASQSDGALKECYAPSMISILEDGNDGARSCAKSWFTANLKATEKLELMGEFLEVEKFDGLSLDSIEDVSASFTLNNYTDESMTNEVSEVATSKDDPSESEKNNDLNPLAIQVSPAAVSPSSDGIDGLSPKELQSRIQSVFESMAKDADVGQILNDIKRVLEDAHDTSIQDSAVVIPLNVQPSDIPCDKKDNSEGVGSVVEKEPISSQEPTQYTQITSDIEVAVSQIHDFILFLDKEAMAVPDI
ncbi:hypothetical protein KIW84_061283 [Lathyrus oleraceus]|uniref:Uncharacterized protein n=1 Tax=Pisum sativum TaxID=3888 RepID=A0A9D5A238_PEA|nr:hypothetical protein KIW84_061283 [Pisum sativum]